MQRKLHPDPRNEERFHEILAASLRLFAQFGYEKTSIDRIAKEVGATKGLVYYYFRSKEEILEAMVEVYDFRPAIAGIAGLNPETPIDEALSLIIRGSIRILDSRMEYVRFLYTEGQFMNRQSGKLWKAILDDWTRNVAAFLEAHKKAGQLRNHDSAIVAQQVVDAVLAYFLRTRVVQPGTRTVTGRQFFEQWIDNFLHGLKA